VALFVGVGAVLYIARGAFLLFLLSLLFADLLEPTVTMVQRRSPLFKNNRTLAIAQVYLVGTILVGGLAYEFGPSVVAQMRRLSTTVSETLDGLTNEVITANESARHGLTAAQQRQIKAFLARHQEFIEKTSERTAGSLVFVASRTIWLFAIPILAIFFLKDERRSVDAFLGVLEQRGDSTRLKRIVNEIDAMLAKYIRAQLALCGLSFLFYSVSMFMLGFPYAIALGLLGGALEFLPAVGWIATAAAILTVGFLTHSHWIWMAGLLVVWRLVQDYVNAPRIMGEKVGLPPLSVLFALMVGAELGGIPGVFLSVPAFAAARIVFRQCAPGQNSPNPRINEQALQLEV
jgi:predicted PurR-regulated permease PerM